MNTCPPVWPGVIVDCGDGSGDGILVLPDELMEQLGWQIGEQLEILIGPDQEIILRRSKEA